VWRSASPVFNVAKSNAPFLIVHGTHDDNVPLAQAQELYEKLQQAGVPVNFVKLEDGHTFTTPEARHRLAAETHAFFNTYLMPSR
jgi:dipeptidyl aminopeptidase/acylaminoacyl peptidase